MKVVVLDGKMISTDPSYWELLNKYVDYKVYDETDKSKVIERAKDSEIILTNKVNIDKEILSHCTKLKLIVELATGYDNIDVIEARKRNIVVSNIPSYSTYSVAQLIFAHLLNICSQVEYHNLEVKKGRWVDSKYFCFCDKDLTELYGKTFGIVGLGEIGKASSHIALGFGMKVITYTSKSQEDLPSGIKKVNNLDELFQSSDVLSISCPLTKENSEFVNLSKLKLMKPSSIIINTSRGGLINEKDLAYALNNDIIFAAGLDVLSKEPPISNNPLLNAKNCYITPHIGWATKTAKDRIINIAIKNIDSFLKDKDKCLNMVN